AEDTHLPVNRESLPSEDLGEPPGTVAALQLHLEQAVLGMNKTKPKGGVLVVLGTYHRDPVGVALDADFSLRSGHDEPPSGLRQRRKEIEDEPPAKDDQQRKQAYKNAQDHGIPSRRLCGCATEFPCHSGKTREKTHMALSPD